MNLKEIIRESINNVILDKIISETIATTTNGQQQPTINYKQYADGLRKLIGNSGIDPKPVQNNQAAAQYIDTLNQFIFNVLDAIDSGNIYTVNSPAATSGGADSNWKNPYEKDNVDIARDASSGVINYLGNGAENVMGYGGNKNPLNGVIKAGVDTYNKDHNALTQALDAQKFSSAYKNTPREISSDLSLETLMSVYPSLYSQYQKINQTYNNIFGATPNVSNCCTILGNLHQAMIDTGKKQTNQQQPPSTSNSANTTTTKPVNTGNNTVKPTNVNGSVEKPSVIQPSGNKIRFSEKDNPNYQKPRPNYSKFLSELSGKGDEIAKIVENVENRTSDENVVNILKWIGNLSDDVASAIQNGSYYNEDYQKTRIKSLTKLMSLDGNKVGEKGTYEWVFWTYQKLHSIYEKMPESIEFKALNQKDVLYTVQSLRFLYTQMKRDKIVDKKSKNNR